MKDNPVKKVAALGQSIWLDYIRRDLKLLEILKERS